MITAFIFRQQDDVPIRTMGWGINIEYFIQWGMLFWTETKMNNEVQSKEFWLKNELY